MIVRICRIIVLFGIFSEMASGRGVNLGKSGRMIDFSSFSNINDFTTIHFDYDAFLDFEKQVIHGTQTLTIKSMVERLEMIDLDVKNLSIHRVQDHNFRYLDYEVLETEYSQEVGDLLRIRLHRPLKSGKLLNISIEFSTNQCFGCYWHDPQQTTDRIAPFFYTLCQPIYCRSIAPFQDTPSIRSTFTLSLTIPCNLSALSSGRLIETIQQDEVCTSKFRQDTPLPSYLFSFTVGHLAEQEIEGNVSIFAEPSLMSSALEQLGNISSYLEAIEEYLGLSLEKWRPFKFVILPSSFLFGGMENPHNIQLAQSTLYGLRQGLNIVFHEIAHFWAGNSVTCSNWTHIWLNEGFATFLERKMVQKLLSKDEYELQELEGQNTLNKTIASIGSEDLLTSLSPDLKGRNPEEFAGHIVYEKGNQFLSYLENEMGEEELRDFLRDYFLQFEGHSIEARHLKSRLERWITQRGLNIDIDWKKWIESTGYPPSETQLSEPTAAQEKIRILAESVLLDDISALQEYKNFSMIKRQLFLGFLGTIAAESGTDLKETQIERLNSLFNFTTESMPLRAIWIKICFQHNYDKIVENALDFLRTCQDYFLVTKIYQGLIVSGNLQLALDTFTEQKPFYHQGVQERLEEDLILYSGQDLQEFEVDDDDTN